MEKHNSDEEALLTNNLDFVYAQARVLLVEDNHIVQLTMRSALEDLGCTVFVAGSGAAGLAVYQLEDINLILMDVGLPDMEGYDVIKAIRASGGERAKTVPVIVLTAHAADVLTRACVDCGADGLLSKPLSRQQAQQLIDRFILHRQVFVQGFQDLTQLSDVNVKLRVIDLEGASVRIGVDKRVVMDLLGALMESLPEITEDFQCLFDRHDYKALLSQVHKFHGGLFYTGVPALEKAVAALEEALSAEQNDRVPELYQAVCDQISALKIEYEDL